MSLDKEIFRVLAEVGDEGLSIRKISIHVHNACNSFFDRRTYDDVHEYVTHFLIRNSRNPNSLIEKTGQRGCYRLNTNSYMTQQLMLQFADYDDHDQSASDNTPIIEDKSLSLF